VDETVMSGQAAADYLGPPPQPPSSAEFSAAGVDQSVLAALMDHGGEVLMDHGYDRSNNGGMETEEFNQNVAAGVLSYVSQNNLDRSMAEGMEEDEDDQESL
jgi:hypothetical protein